MPAFTTSDTYIATRELEVAVNAAVALQRPLLIKGEPGTGKTVLAQKVAEALGYPLIEWHIKSTTKAQQGLYEYDAVARLRDGQLGDPRVHDVGAYIVKGKLWEAFEAETPTVVLIDEIDKADIEFPNDLLLELDRMEFHVYETRETVRAKHRPVVIITSNNEKELPDAFLRRCFFHFIRFPDRDTMESIVQAHFPGIRRELTSEALGVFFGIRDLPGLKKKPATSELLDWLRLLMLEEAPAFAEGSAPPLAGALLKNEHDLHLLERYGVRLRPAEAMLSGFLLRLRAAGLPVSITEHLSLLAALKAGAARCSVEDFYFLSRSALVKDERYYDRFDRVFGATFKDIDPGEGVEVRDLPEEWLRKLAEKMLTREEMARVQALGGFEALMETLRRRLAEQKERHQGGSKWIGTAGTSPFGAYGYNPEGVRIGQHESRHRRAVKVWDKREFRDYDDHAALGGRNVKLALRRLRRFAREGAETELDLPGTVRATASNAGLLDLKLTPERHNTMKLILLLDVGGSMDVHARATSELFAAVRSEFKHLEQFYFHNCPYEAVWKANVGGRQGKLGTLELLRTYGPDYRLVIVGDASMSPYEILMKGGSVEHWNEESGETWLARLTGHFRRAAWLNPEPEKHWGHTHSIGIVRELMAERMYPLSLSGLEAMTTVLRR